MIKKFILGCQKKLFSIHHDKEIDDAIIKAQKVRLHVNQKMDRIYEKLKTCEDDWTLEMKSNIDDCKENQENDFL